MNRTTDDWEALLEGTTEGPWKWDSHRVPTLYGTFPSTTGNHEFHVDVLDAEHDGGCGCRQSCELEINASDDDKTLIATAPEAVAEVVRLRRELEARVRVWGRVADKLESAGYMSNVEVVRHHIGQLTRILKGDTK